MPTSRRIVQFSSGRAAPPGARIVYIDGAFDLFHPGHVAALRAARERGDFLLVGVHTDADVAARRGPGSPIMDLHERALSVLACRYANEVVIGAPAVITDDLIKTFNIAAVLRGTTVEGGDAPPSTSTRPLTAGEADRYAVPRARGIFETFSSPSPLTAASLVDRIVANRTAYEARNAAKTASERAYYGQKTYVGET
jgi:ethanolamine-phosphate cytidylyltransferase